MPEIGQLQGSASGVGQTLAFLVAIAAKIEDKSADRIRGKDAIVDHGIPCGITLDGLILAEGPQKIGKRLLRNTFGEDRFAQRDEDGMRRAAMVTIIQLTLPPIEELEGALFLRNFVAEIIGPAAISIEIIEMLVQIFRK